jgi:hypothetical protein
VSEAAADIYRPRDPAGPGRLGPVVALTRRIDDLLIDPHGVDVRHISIGDF